MSVEPRLRQRTQAPETENPDEDDPDDDDERPEAEHRSNGSRRCQIFCASPQFKLMIFVIIGFVPIFGISVVLPKILVTKQCTSFFCKSGHWFFSIWIAAQFLYNFSASQWTHPGGTLKHKPPYEATGQYELNINPTADEATKEGDMHILFAPNFCEHCQHWKPPRSHHCSLCKRCVLRMDHHCPFTGNCIGMRNHGHFILMYVFAIVGLTYCMYMTLSVLWSTPGFQKGVVDKAVEQRKIPLFSPGFAGFVTYLAMQVLLAAGCEIGILIIGASLALFAVLGFGVPAMWMASSGGTIIEHQFPMKEYVQIKPTVYCPLGPGFYQRGRLENLRVILGPRWFLRLLFPNPGGVIDITPGLCPTPGDGGLHALKSRIAQVEAEGVQQSVSSYKELGFNPGPSDLSKTGDV